MSQVSVDDGRFRYSIAEPGDREVLRGLMRGIPVGSWIELTFEREPDPFLLCPPSPCAHAYLIARDMPSGAAVGVCERFVRRAYIDGVPTRLPWLGLLRVRREYRNRIALLRGGFRAVQALLTDPSDPPFCVTTITTDNSVAVRVLEANLAGMPRYDRIGMLRTFALRTRRHLARPGVERASARDMAAIAQLLQTCYASRPLAPVVDDTELRLLALGGGPTPSDFLLVRDGSSLRGCIALWDQSAYRQTVVRRYASWLGAFRPVVNVAASAVGLPSLPAPNQRIGNVYLSLLACDNGEVALCLIEAALSEAHRRGFKTGLIGVMATDPLTAVIEAHYRSWTYRSNVYLVEMDQSKAVPLSRKWDNAHLEIAFL